MFSVHCPVTMVWHPAVHHSLLLLRALKQRHTLVLEPAVQSDTGHSARLPFPLLCSSAMPLRITHTNTTPHDIAHNLTDTRTRSHAQRGGLRCVYRPEDILHLVSFSVSSSSSIFDAGTKPRAKPRASVSLTDTAVTGNAAKGSPAEDDCYDREDAHLRSRDWLGHDMAAYLDTCAVCSHIHAALDAMLVAMASNDVEVTRRTHAWFMDGVERLEYHVVIPDDEADLHRASPKGRGESHPGAGAYSNSHERAGPNDTHRLSTDTPSDITKPTTSADCCGMRSSATTRRVAEDDDEATAMATKPLLLSTWPLYATLQFLLVEAGLIASAFPRLTRAFARLSESDEAVRLHQHLVRQTVDLFLSSPQSHSVTAPQTAAPGSLVHYESRHFLHEVQRRLKQYNTSVRDDITDGVVGEHGG